MKFVMILVTGFRVWAEPILFRAPDAGELEYRARLRAEETWQTPTQAYLAQHPAPRAREALLARFTRAQQAFLANSIGEARRHFQEVVALLPTDDWAASDREVFVNAFLRLAQLENGATDRDHWLAQVSFLGPNPKIQSDLFPPPLLERLRELQTRQRPFRLDLGKVEWPLVLINGIPCRAHACPSFPAAESSVRLTFLSDQWAPQTVQADLGEFARLRVNKAGWVSGTCGRGGLTAEARDLGPGRAFFGLKCEETSAPASGDHPPASLTPTLETTVAGETSLAAAVVTPVERKSRPFYKSPWLWAGIGAVALTAIAVAVSSSGRKSSPAPDPAPPPAPTTVYGF